MPEPTNGGTAPPNDGRRQLILNAQYVKDLSFENPRAAQSLIQPPTGTPDLHINVDVKAQGLGPDTYEVTMTLRVGTTIAGDTIFMLELAYAGVASLLNTTPPEAQVALMVEVPKLLFPFARAIVSNTTRDGGYQPLLLNPIDFAELYRVRLAQAQQQQDQQPPPPPPGPITA